MSGCALAQSTAVTRPSWVDAALLLALLLLFAGVFYAVDVPGGGDLRIWREAAQRVLDGEPLYGGRYAEAYSTDALYYYNPPWLAIGMIPFALVPLRIAYTVLSVATLTLSVVLLHHWAPAPPGLLRAALALSCPPVIYTLVWGQVDLIVAAGVLLPAWCWPLVALTKPQVALGLPLLTPRREWLMAGIVTGAVVIVAVIGWGWLRPVYFDQPGPTAGANNLWHQLWPMTLPVGVFLLTEGLRRRDPRWLLCASPFLSPYAPLSTLAAPFLIALPYLARWQAAVVWAVWWAVLVAQAL